MRQKVSDPERLVDGIAGILTEAHLRHLKWRQLILSAGTTYAKWFAEDDDPATLPAQEQIKYVRFKSPAVRKLFIQGMQKYASSS